MKLVERIMTKNPCYRAGRKITVKGLMLHSVGVGQPRAEVFIRAWDKETYDRACVHGFIDANDGTVYQTLPWDHRGWHCGSGKKGSANNTHIGVEMCEPAEISYTSGAKIKIADGKLEKARAAAKRTYFAAVELFAMLCKKYGLDPLKDGVILSHAEGNKRGIASAHVDPEHLWKQLGMDYSMDGFRQEVKEAMDRTEDEEAAKAGDGAEGENTKTTSGATGGTTGKATDGAAGGTTGNATDGTAGGTTGKAGDGVAGGTTGNATGAKDPKSMTNADCPFIVRIRVSDLNIRKGPGTDTARTGKYTGIGAYTIVEVKPGKGSVRGWGLMKSKIGWISLDYCERVR